MNKLVLTSLLLIFGSGTVAQAETAENCPCLHLTKKAKTPVSQPNIVILQDEYIAPKKMNGALPAAQPIQVVKPVAKTPVTPKQVAAAHAEPVEMAKESQTNKNDHSNLTSFYMGFAAGTHHGGISSSSPSTTYHFTGRIFGGYNLTDNLSVEVGYFNVRSELISSSSVERESRNITRNTNLLKARRHGFDLLGIYKSTDTVPGLYAKAGLGFERINFKDTVISAVSGIPVRDRTSSGHVLSYGDKAISVLASRSLKDNADAVVGVGYEIRVMNHLLMNIDFTRYQPIKHEVKMPVNFLSIGAKYQF